MSIRQVYRSCYSERLNSSRNVGTGEYDDLTVVSFSWHERGQRSQPAFHQ